MKSDKEATSMARKMAEAKNSAAEMEVELADAKAGLSRAEEYKAMAEQLQVGSGPSPAISVIRASSMCL